MNQKHANGLAIVVAVISLVVAIWASLSSTRSQTAHRSPSEPESITTLRVGIVPAPPVSLYDAGTGLAEGHAIDLMNAISSRSGVKVQYIAADWSTMGALLTTRKADLIVGPVFMTEQRARDFGFTDEQYIFAVVAVVAQNSSTVTSLEDLQKPGLRVAVGKGGFDAEFVSRSMPNAVVSAFPPDDPNLSMLEVSSGRADVAFVDYANAQKFAELNKGVVVLQDMVVSSQMAGFMTRPTDFHLRGFLNTSLKNLVLSGEAERIDGKYQSTRIWLRRPMQN